MYFDYPLEQGLRLFSAGSCTEYNKYFDYPLEQGLRQKIFYVHNYFVCILIIH